MNASHVALCLVASVTVAHAMDDANIPLIPGSTTTQQPVYIPTYTLTVQSSDPFVRLAQEEAQLEQKFADNKEKNTCCCCVRIDKEYEQKYQTTLKNIKEQRNNLVKTHQSLEEVPRTMILASDKKESPGVDWEHKGLQTIRNIQTFVGNSGAALVYIKAGHNELTEVSLADMCMACPNLEELYLNNNAIEYVTPVKNAYCALRILDLSQNKLVSVNVDKLLTTNMEHLNLSGNPITSFTAKSTDRWPSTSPSIDLIGTCLNADQKQTLYAYYATRSKAVVNETHQNISVAWGMGSGIVGFLGGTFTWLGLVTGQVVDSVALSNVANWGVTLSSMGVPTLLFGAAAYGIAHKVQEYRGKQEMQEALESGKKYITFERAASTDTAIDLGK